MTKILCVVGARPNFMKIAPILRAFATHAPGIDAMLVHTGQHYDYAMNAAFFDDLGIPAPDVSLDVGSDTHARQTAEIMQRFEPVLTAEQPDAVLVVGDVNSTIACALVAAKLGVKVVHVEAGLRSRDRSMPEEINRILTDQLSDRLYTTEAGALDNLVAEGIAADKVVFAGNVMIDTLLANRPRAVPAATTIAAHAPKPSPSRGGLGGDGFPSGTNTPPQASRAGERPHMDVRTGLASAGTREGLGGDGFQSTAKPPKPSPSRGGLGGDGFQSTATDPQTFTASPTGYAVLTLHRPSNVDDDATLSRLLDTLADVARDVPIVFPMHPRTGKRIVDAGREDFLANPRILAMPPAGYFEMLGLVTGATLVMTDSGGLQEETTALGIPCITLRENTERPTTLTQGTNTLVGRDPDAIHRAVADTLETGGKRGRVPEKWDGHAAERIVNDLGRWLTGKTPATAPTAVST